MKVGMKDEILVILLWKIMNPFNAEVFFFIRKIKRNKKMSLKNPKNLKKMLRKSPVSDV